MHAGQRVERLAGSFACTGVATCAENVSRGDLRPYADPDSICMLKTPTAGVFTERRRGETPSVGTTLAARIPGRPRGSRAPVG
jgi:hypothetical protein